MNTYTAASGRTQERSSKEQIQSSKQYPNAKNQKHKPFDFEERALLFAQTVIGFLNRLPKTAANIETSKQLIRSSGAVGANYIEANDSLGKKDLLMRLRIARKESKESRYWLELLECPESSANHRANLVNEATELLKILSAMIQKSE
ncbi:MAG TPA: four helix bundle protein [Candidatus Kryptobacter bacterium]|nr:four helix bundle protein [Candidatus Kryptobacter bacterium]